MPEHRGIKDDRWRGPPRKDVFGYCQDLSVTCGDVLQVKISSEQSSFDVSVVRLQHGVENPHGIGVKESIHPSPADGRYPGRQQPIKLGSFMRAQVPRELASLRSFGCSAWIQPTMCGQGEQGILSRWCDSANSGFAVLLGQAGDLELWLGDGITALTRLCTGVALLPHQWTFIAASVNLDEGVATLVQRPVHRWPGADSWATYSAPFEGTAIGASELPLLVAAIGDSGGPSYHFNGKIEAPMLTKGALTIADIEAEMESPGSMALRRNVIVTWDFAVGMSGRLVTDRSPNKLHGELVNRPARAVTGHRWNGRQTDWTQAPEQYSAIHFHSDDLEDAAWDTDLEVPIDDSFSSGIYAVRLTAGESEDRVPFVVRPSPDGPRARLAVLLPTLTYQAYANARFFGGSAAKIVQAEDEYVLEHGLISLYDLHCDGSPVYYASRLRPSTIRPAYYAQNIGAPARLSADLCLIDWLMEEEIDHDVVTDEDLHREGMELLSPYRAVLSGSHPEYTTDGMLEALEQYLNRGGNFAYLGGNGYYWITTIDPDCEGVIEVRRGETGSRTQSANPGEYHHSSTGELGGLWRFRGRTPQSLFGVGMTAWGAEQGTGYRRLQASHDPRASFIFEGVNPDDVIGNFGIVLGGAAGYEIDRLDFTLGTPPHALLLATSAGLHSQTYLPSVEEIMDMEPSKIDAASSRYVRADMVFFETGRGGAVFSSGSITWTGSLSHNNYNNSVSTITRNVVRRFTSGVRFDAVNHGS